MKLGKMLELKLGYDLGRICVEILVGHKKCNSEYVGSLSFSSEIREF